MKHKGTTMWRLLLILAMILLNVTAVSAAPAGSAVSSATPSDATPDIGDTITVTVNVDMTGVTPPDNKLGSFTATLNWNTAVLSYVAFSGTMPSPWGGGVINDTNVDSGVLTFNSAYASGLTGSFTILTCQFNVVGNGTSPLDLAYSAMSAATTFGDLRTILTINDGTVTVGAQPTNTPTNTPVVPTFTPTRTNTPVVPTNTPTNTPVVPTNTPTNTPVAGCPGAVSSASPSNGTPAVGTQIVVTVNVDMTAVAAPNNKLGSFTSTLNWNTAVLDYASAVLPAPWGGGVLNETLVDSGQLTFNSAYATGATGNVTILTVTFNVVGAGTSPLDLAYSAMSAATTFCDLLPGATINDSSVTASAAATATRTNTPVVPTNTPTNTPVVPTATRTNTPVVPTATRTNTPVVPTPTRTNTPMGPTPTRTNTPVTNCAGAVSSASPSNSAPAVGTQIVVTVNVDMSAVPSAHNKLGSFTGTLNWNTSVLDYASAALQGVFAGGVVNEGSVDTGLLTFNSAYASGATGNITVLTVTFNVVGAGTSPLDLGYSAMAAATTFCDLLPGATINDSSVTASGGATPTRTNTPVVPTATRTNTPVGPTPTRTNTPVGPTPTRTNTPVAGCAGAVSSASPSNSAPAVGTQIVVTVNVDMSAVPSPNNKLGSFTGTLNWNTSVLAYSSAALQGVFAGGVVNDGSVGTGLLTFSSAYASGASGNITVLTVTFNVVGAGTSPLNLGYSAMAAATTFCDLLPGATINDSSVTASGGATPTRTNTPVGPTPTRTATPVPGDCPGAVAEAQVSNAAPSVGQQIVVTIWHDMTGVAPPNDLLGSFTGTLNWNPAILQYASNTGLPAGWTGNINVADAASGQILFNGANANGVSGAGAATTITFNVLAAGTTALDLSYSAMASAQTFCNLLSGATIVDGSVTATGEPGDCDGASSSAIPSNAAPNVGEQITVAIYMDMTAVAAPDNYLGSFTGALNYDPAILDYVSDTGPLNGFSGVVNVNEAGGQILFNGAKAEGASGAGNALVITFNVVGTGTSALDLSYSAMAAAGTFCDLLPGLTVNDGSVTVGGGGPTCYLLTLTHTGNGADPVASPPNSTGCSTGRYVAGEAISLTAEPDSGWTVGSWSGTANDASTSTNNQVTMPAAAHTVGVNYVEGGTAQYMLTTVVDPAGSGWMTPWAGEHIYDAGTVINVTATPYEGFRFDHWSGACDGAGACQVLMDANKTVTAHFVELTYKLTVAVDPVGGGTTSPSVGDHYYSPGAVVEIMATPNSGYEFDYWSGACSGSGDCLIEMDADKTVTAHFTPSTFTLTVVVDPVGAGTTTPWAGDHDYPAGEVVNITATPATGWVFDYWSGACSGSGTCQVTMNSDKTVTAHFTQQMYTLTMIVDPAGGGTTTPAEGDHSYVAGSVVDITATPADGYVFDSWSGACTGTGTCQVTMNSDKTVTAHFSQVTYTLTVAVDPAGTGTTNPAEGDHDYPANEVVIVTATPATGYEFDFWSGACTGTGDCSVTMDADKSVTAHFKQIMYDLTVAVSPVGAGTTNPAVGTYSYAAGTVVPVTQTPADGYEFTGWSGACTGTDPCSVTMDADKTVTANYVSTVVSYTLTIAVNPVGGGTTNPAVGSYVYPAGTIVPVTATPATGYTFTGWTGACSGTGACAVTVDADKTVTANFAVIPAPDLSVTKQASVLEVGPGETLSYVLTYQNLGGDATGVVITEPIPANTTFNAAASTAGWVCMPNGGNGSTCTFAVGAVANGGSGTVTFAVTVNAQLPAGTTAISNTAMIADDGSHGADTNPANNTVTVQTPIKALLYRIYLPWIGKNKVN